MNRKISFVILAIITAFFTSCDDNDNNQDTPITPTTYTFDNVDYSGQTARIQMMDLLETTIKSANDGVTKVTAQELTDIFENTSGDLFGSSKDIASKTEESFVPTMYSIFETVENRSGVAENVLDGRLYDANGHEMAQMAAKGLMGALLYYQATSVYLSEDKMNVDNTEVTEGKGTAMQHHWDEAFGYFGAVENYLDAEDATNWYWAKYANSRSAVVDVRADIFNAFIAGRAAINNNDLAARDAAIDIIREKWELLVAINVVHYINSSIADLEAQDVASLNHHWSEAKAFGEAFYYNIDKSFTNENITALQGLLGENPSDATVENLRAANILLQQHFSLTDQQVLDL